jgi:alpha-galactosidase
MFRKIRYFNYLLALVLSCGVHGYGIGKNKTPFSWCSDTLIVNDKQSTQGFLFKQGALWPVFSHANNRPGGIDRYTIKECVASRPFGEVLSTHVYNHYIEPTERSSGYHEVELHSIFDDGELKYIIKVYDDSPGIEWQLAAKGELLRSFTAHILQEDTAIEDVSLLSTAGSHYFYLPLRDPHRRIRITQFREMTDHYNNLVQEQELLPYTKAHFSSGNVLMAVPSDGGPIDIIVKLAPIAHAQANYYGADYSVQLDGVRVYSTGFDTSEDIREGDWHKSYPLYILKYAKTETEALLGYKKYEHAVHRYLPEKDNTFTMNTWGNRNRDSRINEEFILNELDAADSLGITYYQIDDGWQRGLSRNSSQKAGELWDDWSTSDWEVNRQRFPNGFVSIGKKAKDHGIKLGLWFNPSKHNFYENWERDRDIMVDLYKKLDVSWIKIDGLALGDKVSEERVSAMLEQASLETGQQIQFNMDVTAGKRGGYFFLNRVGNTFLENRYTDWGNFYPHLALRNAWQLAKYVPMQRFQIEWLDKWRNKSKYPSEDPLQPYNIPFDYQFAITMMAQPLAWMEATALPPEAFLVKPLIDVWKGERSVMQSGIIHPIGDMPTGFAFTGFVSYTDDRIYVLVFREMTEGNTHTFKLPYCGGKLQKFTKLWGEGEIRDLDTKEGAFSTVFDSHFQFLWGYFDVELSK